MEYKYFSKKRTDLRDRDQNAQKKGTLLFFNGNLTVDGTNTYTWNTRNQLDLSPVISTTRDAGFPCKFTPGRSQDEAQTIHRRVNYWRSEGACGWRIDGRARTPAWGVGADPVPLEGEVREPGGERSEAVTGAGGGERQAQATPG